jgi:hypothetical protein
MLGFLTRMFRRTETRAKDIEREERRLLERARRESAITREEVEDHIRRIRESRGRVAILAALALCGARDFAKAGAIEALVGHGGPECVPLATISEVAKVSPLTHDQFQFVRAVYIAIPPVSHELPPGDSAVMATADGQSMLALVADSQACGRFLAPDFMVKMIESIGRGENGQPPGKPL